MVGSVDSESSKKSGSTPNRRAANRVQDDGMPAIFTEEALHRLEAGLQAQREQDAGLRAQRGQDAGVRTHQREQEAGPPTQREREQHQARRLYEPDAPSSPPGNWGAWQDGLGNGAPTEPTSEAAPSVLDGEEPARLPFWRSRTAAALLGALLLLAGAAALRVSLTARTGPPSNATAAAIEQQKPAPAKDAPPNAVRSAAGTPSRPAPSPARPDEKPGDAHLPGTPAPPAERSAEAQGPSKPAGNAGDAQGSTRPGEHAVEAQGSAPPAAAATPEPPPLQAPAAAAAKPSCNVAACRRYHSFRVSDCTFVPRHSHGKRRHCDR
jgi:hypothetical protein